MSKETHYLSFYLHSIHKNQQNYSKKTNINIASNQSSSISKVPYLVFIIKTPRVSKQKKGNRFNKNY